MYLMCGSSGSGFNVNADQSSNEIQTLAINMLLNDTSSFGGKYRVTREKRDLFSGWNICKIP